MLTHQKLKTLKIACIEKGIPQRTLARMVGIHESVLSNAIAGRWILNELQHGFKMRYRYAGEADHERRAEHEIGRVLCHIIEHLPDMRLIAPPMHTPKYFILGVLQRHIKIRRDLAARAEAVDQCGCDRVWIGIQHP